MEDGASDEALMAEIAAGRQDAMRLLMDRHMPRAIRLAQRLGGVDLDTDEIAQEAFLRVWRHAARYDARRALFTTWLYQIVLNLALDARRRQRYRNHQPIEAAEAVASSASNAEDDLLHAERQMLAQRALDSLPERQRAAIVLFYVEGLSGREGAATLEVSEKSFKSLLSRGRAACRNYVAAMAAKGDGR